MSENNEEEPQPVVLTTGKTNINEKDYYMVKINSNFKKLHELLVFSLITGFIDLSSKEFSKVLFKNTLHKSSITFYFLCSSFCLLFYKIYFQKIDVINAFLYKKLIYFIYISIIACVLMEIDLIYMLIFKVFFHFKVWINFIANELNNIQIICSIFSFLIFVLFNSTLPFILVIRVRKIKKLFILVGNIQGQDFDECIKE